MASAIVQRNPELSVVILQTCRLLFVIIPNISLKCQASEPAEEPPSSDSDGDGQPSATGDGNGDDGVKENPPKRRRKRGKYTPSE